MVFFYCSGGYAFVTFKSKQDAKRCIEILNQKKLSGRPIIIDYAADTKLYKTLNSGVEKLPQPDFSRLRLADKKQVRNKMGSKKLTNQPPSSVISFFLNFLAGYK